MNKHYDIIFLVEVAIGNTLEVLYAVEYCLKNNVKAGILLNKMNFSFQEYLRKCYGNDVILISSEGVSTTNLVHTFIYTDVIEIEYTNYLYIYPDVNSTKYLSETEQYLSCVRALYPSKYHSYTLDMLFVEDTQRVRNLNIEEKYVIYPGSSSFSSVKRWPSYIDLSEKIGKDKVIFVGGLDDLNYQFSYIYKSFVTKIFPYQITNRKTFWNLSKNLNMLEPFSHYKNIENLDNSYFNIFSWGELVYIFKHCKGFIGNDGGLMHLASASGAKGVAIFGPSSVDKNKSYNPDMKEIFTNYSCQPCQFNIENIYMAKFYISCPYQVKCMTDIHCENILSILK